MMSYRFNRALLCALTLIFASQLCAQDREQLKQPVYKVSKSDDAGTSAADDLIRGPAPVLENAQAIAPTQPAQPSPEQAAPMTPAETSGHATEEPTSVASLDKGREMPAAPRISEAQETLNCAVTDARNILAYIEENVADYECLFIKQENVNGKVLPPEYMRLKIRNEIREDGEIVVPFSAYFKFLKPKEIKNREVLYVAGRYDTDKLLAKEGSGGRRFLPAVALRTDSRFVMCSNRYPLTEVGVATLTRRLIERSEEDRNVDDCEITYTAGAKIDGRPCKFLQVKRPTPKVGKDAEFGMNVFLAQVFIDEELNLPVRYAAYTWPRVEGGAPEVVESYTYKDLKVNVGLTDADFDPKNPAYNF